VTTTHHVRARATQRWGSAREFERELELRAIRRRRMRATRRWASSREFLHELDLLAIERNERRQAEVRRINEHIRLGVASADELRLVGPVQRIGRVD
jgi:hypothetical protein